MIWLLQEGMPQAQLATALVKAPHGIGPSQFIDGTCLS